MHMAHQTNYSCSQKTWKLTKCQFCQEIILQTYNMSKLFFPFLFQISAKSARFVQFLHFRIMQFVERTICHFLFFFFSSEIVYFAVQEEYGTSASATTNSNTENTRKELAFSFLKVLVKSMCNKFHRTDKMYFSFMKLFANHLICQKQLFLTFSSEVLAKSGLGNTFHKSLWGKF